MLGEAAPGKRGKDRLENKNARTGRLGNLLQKGAEESFGDFTLQQVAEQGKGGAGSFCHQREREKRSKAEDNSHDEVLW